MSESETREMLVLTGEVFRDGEQFNVTTRQGLLTKLLYQFVGRKVRIVVEAEPVGGTTCGEADREAVRPGSSGGH